MDSKQEFSIEIFSSISEGLKNDFKLLTEKIMNKPLRYANKQLQDTLVNYYIQNNICPILRQKYQITKSLHALQKEMQKAALETQGKTQKKYIAIMNYFVNQIQKEGLHKEYEQMLRTLVNTQKPYEFGSEKWRTQLRKRMLSLLLAVHWCDPDRQIKYKNFFDLWKVIFPHDPISSARFRKFQENKKIKEFINAQFQRKSRKYDDEESKENSFTPSSPSTDCNSTDQNYLHSQIPSSKIQEKKQNIKTALIIQNKNLEVPNQNLQLVPETHYDQGIDQLKKHINCNEPVCFDDQSYTPHSSSKHFSLTIQNYNWDLNLDILNNQQYVGNYKDFNSLSFNYYSELKQVQKNNNTFESLAQGEKIQYQDEYQDEKQSLNFQNEIEIFDNFILDELDDLKDCQMFSLNTDFSLHQKQQSLTNSEEQTQENLELLQNEQLHTDVQICLKEIMGLFVSLSIVC